LIGAFLLLGLGCAGLGENTPAERNIVRKAPGALFQLGEIREKDLETPPYLPAKIRFEAEKLLRERGLLATGGPSEKRLSVNITVEAVYAGYGETWIRKERYSYFDSAIQVLDPEKGDLVATARMRAYGAWGAVTSDFIETNHARDIVDFLEGIVR
jgi:hypothetical protein